MSEENTTLEAYLADHPRMIGVLFTVLVLLTQASSAMANGGCTNAGP